MIPVLAKASKTCFKKYDSKIPKRRLWKKNTSNPIILRKTLILIEIDIVDIVKYELINI